MYGIYARQSVERADSISIESQLEFCRYETRGGEYIEYIDRGYSGKNTERPRFQEMLQDIRAGKLDHVVVYKLDRISRSILDFSNMMELFQKYHVDFISSTEKFDTSTPMGRAMLNICIVFAQLERETIQKRVTDAYYSRCRRGLYMGGRPPYGFRKEEIHIDGIRTAHFVPIPEEAEIIKKLYFLYSHTETSLNGILQLLREDGTITAGGKKWSSGRVSELLRNPVYVRADERIYQFFQGMGIKVENPPSDFLGRNGCYLYQSGGENGSVLVLAPHEGLVDSAHWLACRNKCSQNRLSNTSREADPSSWLSGMVKCGKCGYAMSVKKTRAEAGRYFLCSGRMNHHICEGNPAIYLSELEELVFAQIMGKLAGLSFLPPEESRRQAALRQRVSELEGEIQSLIERVNGAGEALMGYLNERVDVLERERRSLLGRLRPAEGNTCPLSSQFSIIWNECPQADRHRLAACLIQELRIQDTAIQIRWRF